MNDERVKEVVDSLSAREAERMQELLALRLQTCAIDGADGATPYRIARKGIIASILLCPACFSKHRLPEGRSEE